MPTHNPPDVEVLYRQDTRRASATGARVLMGLVAVGALGAGGVAVVDGILTAVLVAAYSLSRGWRAWSCVVPRQAPFTHCPP